MGAGPTGQIGSFVLFNVAAIVAILFGIKERKKALGGSVRFKGSREDRHADFVGLCRLRMSVFYD